ncbi:MAG: prepilin-type N-terminal cleavage/methylation domain-containing protein [Bdellovibrionia bacterium]
MGETKETASLRKRRDPLRLLSDSKGFGLVEVMIAAAVGSVVMLSMSSMMNNMNQSVRGTRTVATRDQLATRIGREAGNSTALGKSVDYAGGTFPANGTGSWIEKCVNGLVSNGCVARDPVTGAHKSYGFTLTDAMGNPVAGPSVANAAVYDTMGALCGNAATTPPSINCPVIAYAYFDPLCPSDANTCDRATTITVHYNLEQRSGITIPAGMSMPTINTMTGKVAFSVPFPADLQTGVGNMLAKWTSSTVLTSSEIWEDPLTKYVGIGTTGPSAKLFVQDTRTDTATNTQAANIFAWQVIDPPAASASTFSAGIFRSASSGADRNLTSGISALSGISVWYEPTATLSNSVAVEATARNVTGGSGVITSAIGLSGTVNNETNGTITAAYGVRGRVFNYKPAGTITTAYGGHFEIQPASADPGISGAHKLVDNGYGVYIGNVQATNKWALYTADSTVPSQFSGTLTVVGQASGWNTAAGASLYVGKDAATSRSINMAGSMNAGGADFAEWVEWKNGPKPEMGSVIQYKGIYVVVSSEKKAAFVGNDILDPAKSILVAFAGQLPVLVKGQVHLGDLIIGNGDGTGRAVARKDVTFDMAQRAVGTAWEASDDPGLKRVNVAVGLGLSGGGARDIASLNEKLRQENAALSSEVNDLKSRLDQIEKALKLH